MTSYHDVIAGVSTIVLMAPILKVHISFGLYFVETGYNFWSTSDIKLKLTPVTDIMHGGVVIRVTEKELGREK